MEARVLKGITATEALAALQINPEWLRASLVAGEIARDGCGPLLPTTFPGLSGWAHTIERLRLEAGPHGWRPITVRNMPMIESPNGQVAIVSIRGDEAVGDELRSPRTRRDRGPVTARALRSNAEQLSFLGSLPGLIEKRVTISHPFTFVLLSNRIGSKIHCELSLPLSMDEDNHVSQWVERIILPPIELQSSLLPERDDDEEDGPIEVPVTRK